MLIGKVLLIAVLVALGCWLVNLMAGEMIAGQASVIDGDTIEIHGSRIRLFGIDAVESSQTCTFRGRSWPCGRRAAEALADFVGKAAITCRPTGGNSHGRIVARCFKSADEDLARYMTQQGWSVAWTRFSTDYLPDEEIARRDLRGIWCSIFELPWLYRRERKSPQQEVPPEGG